MSLSDFLLRALERVRPTQLQVYRPTDETMRLHIVASITGIVAIDVRGQVHCPTGAVFSSADNGWRTESAGNLTLPGTVTDILNCEVAGDGRLILDLPLVRALVVLFPSNDLGAHSPYRTTGLTISLMNLSAIAMQAQAPAWAVIEAEHPPDDD